MSNTELTVEKLEQLQDLLRERMNVLLKSFISNECRKYNKSSALWLLVVDVFGASFCNSLFIASDFIDEIEMFDKMTTEMREILLKKRHQRIEENEEKVH